jgi:tight adherence protein B
MILLDDHGLGPGRRIPAERHAVLKYLEALPGWVRAGLITFNTSCQLRLVPTTGRRLMARALDAVTGTKPDSTGLYAAITAAEQVIGRLGARPARLLILSNGEDVLSRSLSPQVPVDVVTWHYDADDNIVELRALASASDGHVAAPAQAASLAAAFWPGRKAPAPASHSEAIRVPWLLVTGLACVFLGLLLAALLLLRPLGPGSPRRIVKRIERYGTQRAPAPSGGPGPEAAGPGFPGPDAARGDAALPERHEPAREGTAARAALDLAASVLRSTNAERGLARRLDHAGIARSPAEWALLTACGGVVLVAALTLLTGSALLGIPVGALGGWAAMRLVVSFRTARRRAAFAEQLPDALRLIAGSLQSGFSLPQAVDAVVREDSQPASGELSRALAEVRVGADLADALDRVADRMESADLRLTVMAVRIQRDVGGNLAEVLHSAVGTMRERAFLRRQVRALSAEGRMSAYILLALPFLVGAWFFYMDPKYMSLLYTTMPGLLMTAGSLGLVVAGVLWMRKLINIEV